MTKLPNEFSWVDQSDQQFAEVLSQILTTKTNLNIIAPAGSGKSLLIKIASQLLKGNVAICSTTGISAVNLNSEDIKASTLHSFFHLEPLSYFPESKINPDIKLSELIKATDVLIIDEVSMLSSHIFDVIYKLMKKSIGTSEKLPRLLLFSDIFQLPPVVSFTDSKIQKFYKDEYGGNVMFFNSSSFESFEFKTFLLNRIYRQKNMDFQQILNRIRVGDQTSTDLNILNEKVMTQKEFDKKRSSYIYLATTNRVVEQANSEYINNFEGETFHYDYSVVGNYDIRKIPKDRLNIALKENMQIMCTKNAYEEGYRNGTLGIVTNCYPKSVDIISDDGHDYHVVTSTVKQFEYFVNSDGKLDCRATGAFTQLDARVSKAITVHKCQGQTLDAIYFNPGNYVFADGLVYVALSRLTSLDGLGLFRPLKMNDIKVNKESLDFLEKHS